MQPIGADDDVEKIKNKALALRQVNHGLSNEIESLGGQVDLATARVEHLLAFLAEEGVLTEGQIWREEHGWEWDLRHQLVEIRNKLKARATSTVKPLKKKKLWTPGT